MYLLDTCVFSEFSKKGPSESVLAWARSVPESDMFLSVLVLGELLRGIAKLPEGFRKRELRHWVETLFVTHQARLIGIDTAVAHVWAAISAQAESAGRALPAVDSLIGASALAHNLVLVTRNGKDFDGMGVEILDPW